MKIRPPFYIDNGHIFTGFILGVVTSLDVVYSKFTGDEVEHHDDHWSPNRHYKKWRWSSADNLHWFLPDHKPNVEQLQFVRDHLTKKYGLKWFKNGYYDWEDLSMRKQDLKNSEVDK